MKISVIGMGYVGAVCSACFAQDGHEVIGVDVDPTKVNLINNGQSPIIEAGLEKLISEGIKNRRLRATTDLTDAVKNTDLSIICVGTPSQMNGNLDLRYIRNVCEEIGEVLKEKDDYHVVCMRSTVLPGTAHDIAIPVLEDFSGKKNGEGFGYASNPEFLRESTAIYDFYNPPKTVIGESDKISGDLVASLHEKLPAPLVRVDIPTAEMIKYADNSWHAVKVTFGNEIGIISKKLGIDGQKVMEVFCMDEKLNISPYYLRPGFAFGGSCLPKDVRAITYKAHSIDVDVPLLNSLMPSNISQIDRVFDMIQSSHKNKIALLGLSFKADTDDLRESPIVTLVEKMIGKGIDLEIYDKNVSLAKLTGANKAYLENTIPHISKLLKQDLNQVIDKADVVIIAHVLDEFKNFADIRNRVSDDTMIIDLVRITDEPSHDNYEGICW